MERKSSRPHKARHEVLHVICRHGSIRTNLLKAMMVLNWLDTLQVDDHYKSP
jgi:hypothetical protein